MLVSRAKGPKQTRPQVAESGPPRATGPTVHRLVSQPVQVRGAASATSRERAEVGPRITCVISYCSFLLPTGVDLLAEMATTDECSSNDTTKKEKQSVDSAYLVGHTSDEVAPSTSSTVRKSLTLNAKTIAITISKTIGTTAVPNCTMRISAILPTRLKPLAIFHTPLGERWSSIRQYVQLLLGRCLRRAFSWKKGSPAPLELLPKADGHLCADSQHDPAIAGMPPRAPNAGTALRVFP